ncbi:MAG: hypothetical protein ACRDK3_13630 [Actinomycetota bacterium]
MSDPGAYESDMGWLSKLRDEEIEQVFVGEYAGEDPVLDDLAAFARDAKTALEGAPGDATRVAHLAALAEAAADLEGQVVPHTPAAPRSPLRRMKPVLASLLATLTAKLTLASVALAATTGGLAATGSLPEPAQEALAKAAAKAGFELPAGDDGETEEEDGEGIPEELPEQTEGSPAQAVLDVIRNWAGEKGCEFGHAVAEAAGGDPGPCRDEDDGEGEDGETEGRPEGAGKPEGTPQGKPDGAGDGGKPEGTPDGKPEGAGKPEGTPGGQPDTAGPPEGTPSGGGGGEDSGSDSGGPPSDISTGKPGSVPGGQP